ncbi:hypothetical protein JBE38_13725 [Pseudomonas sp. ICBG1301]|uniref:portal protein n=1 Tax=Pseudomonas sp. ICBG1301 TaxID=2795987 RepID=UPI001962CBB9|nr:hypothetical protein [Pseudomonas sp. ICBG1301]MBM9486986.1 hypothetical protein [Pseudomonas sp. ICBG1301]
MAEFGLLQVRSAADLHADDLAAEADAQQSRRAQLVESSLAAHIRRCFDSAKSAKRDIDQRLLDCARRQKGVHDETKLQAIRENGGSEAYPKLTTTKCRAGAAWIRDILMPAVGHPWGLDPTPVADIPPEFLAAFQQKLAQQMQVQAQQSGEQGEQAQVQEMPDPAQIETKLRELIQEKAKEATEAHEFLIADQLAEGGWETALEEFIDDFTIYPAAFIKGPMLQRVPQISWGQNWQMMETEEIQPLFFRVSPFDIYPSPDSTNTDDGAFMIERERYTRSRLNALLGVPGYNDNAVRQVLTDHGQGGLRDWLTTDSQRARLEDKAGDWMVNNGDTIEGVHYWGGAQGLMLLQWGVDPAQVPDVLGEYEVDAILIGTHVIRCVINRNPLGGRPYHKASFQIVPGSFWGMSIPELMSDVQDMCGATARAQSNNMAFASGPQVEVDEDRLQPGENPNEMFPMKRWRVKSGQTAGLAGGATAPVLRFYQPVSLAGELMAVYDSWEKRADDATNIPRYIYGAEKVGGAGNTASGLSMLMESANKGIKDAIRHIDRGVVRRVIEALWLFNMRYSEDNAIKGDCKVVARGANAMLQREQTLQARTQFLGFTNNPTDMQILGLEGRAAILRKVAESLDMPGLVPTKDEMKAREDQQQQQAAQQQQEQAKLAGQQVAAETGKTAAQTEELSARADKIRIEAQRLGMENGATVAQLQHASGGANETQRPPVASAGQPEQQPGLEAPAGVDEQLPAGGPAEPGEGQQPGGPVSGPGQGDPNQGVA